ncbi:MULTISPECIES: hypothetical protein [Sphingomonadaceae]|uniref:hypothetical protein n=1 Tax=Sphingomonadales TaxID=204457 RepID=UPI00082AC7AE|nr:hypothetical protein [Sphingobium sp. TKS]MCF8707796.1 hypothetical protein [Rhizorhapis sp. SPR117]
MRPGFLLGCAIAALPAAAWGQTMDDRATAAATASRAKTGDSDDLLNNYVTPGLAGQPVATIDNSKSFNPNLACQKTATLLELLAQPSSTGDIGTLRISRDKDLDGSFDQTLTLPVPVSGICANGVISCQPGTWNQCRDFKWDTAAAGDLKLSEVDQTELAGCYCVNNSCGSNLAWGNLASVLKDLGGGVIGALTTADPRVGVAQASIDGPVIRYTGAQTTACTANPEVAATSYRSNPTAIQGDAFAASQSNSVFQALAASPAGAGKAEETRSCTIEREVTLSQSGFDDIISASGPIQSISDCGTGCRLYQIGGTGNCNDPPATYSVRFSTTRPDRVLSARIVSIFTADWLQARLNGTPVAYAGKRPWLTNSLPSGDCGVGDNYSAAPNYDFATTLKDAGATIDARIRATGSHKSGYLMVEIKVDTSCDNSERLVDLCAGYASDPKCRLDNESVDGVDTFRNGVATGLAPLPQTRLFGTATCTIRLTRDFFERDRRYRCSVDLGSPTPPDLSRGAYIIDHSTETLLADRTTASDGSVSTSTRPFALPDRGSVPACEAICKTRAPKANNDAAIAGVIGASQNNPTGWDTFYHSCSAANVCPLGRGEEIVSGCGCLDDFPEAVVMMQTVRLGGADLVCTSEVR